MAIPRPSDDQLRNVARAMHRNNNRYFLVAKELDVPQSTVKRHWEWAQEKGLDKEPAILPDQFSTYEKIHAPKEPAAKVRGRLKAVTSENRFEGPLRRVVAIGDVHDKPGRSKDRLRWISRFIADKSPDNVIQIGDFLSLDSLSQHDPIGSVKYYERGTYSADLESFQEAVSELNSEGWHTEIPSHITYGNHEYRADRAENENPNLVDTLKLPIDQEWAQYRWQTIPYGDYLFLEGVGFTHVPLNGMGRDYRGKFPENAIGNDALFSIVFGHTHKASYKAFPKIGPSQGIEVCNLGTAMPQGEVENYATLSATGWTWGVKLLTLQSGRIIGEHLYSMMELEEQYD